MKLYEIHRKLTTEGSRHRSLNEGTNTKRNKPIHIRINCAPKGSSPPDPVVEAGRGGASNSHLKATFMRKYSISSSKLIRGQWKWRRAFQSPRLFGEGGPQHQDHTQGEALKCPMPSACLPVTLSFPVYCRVGDGFPLRGYAFEATKVFQQTAFELR